MQRPTGVAIAVLIGLTAVIVPIWFSIHLAWKQSLADETARVRYNAGDVLRRHRRGVDHLHLNRQWLRQFGGAFGPDRLGANLGGTKIDPEQHDMTARKPAEDAESIGIPGRPRSTPARRVHGTADIQ